MLELRPICENCSKDLPNDCTDAMICTFECTFCADCVTNELYNVCPNCGGGFEKRPIRPKTKKLAKYQAMTVKYFKSVDKKLFEKTLIENREIEPKNR